MHRQLPRLFLLATMLVPVLASAVTAEDFEAKTTRNLLHLCTVSANDRQYREAIHFCHDG